VGCQRCGAKRPRVNSALTTKEEGGAEEGNGVPLSKQTKPHQSRHREPPSEPPVGVTGTSLSPRPHSRSIDHNAALWRTHERNKPAGSSPAHLPVRAPIEQGFSGPVAQTRGAEPGGVRTRRQERFGDASRRIWRGLSVVTLVRLGLLVWGNSVPPSCVSLVVPPRGTIHPRALRPAPLTTHVVVLGHGEFVLGLLRRPSTERRPALRGIALAGSLHPSLAGAAGALTRPELTSFAPQVSWGRSRGRRGGQAVRAALEELSPSPPA